MYFVVVPALTFDPVYSFLEVAKIIYQTHLMLTYVFKLQIFISCISQYVMYVMLCMQRQSNNCIHETCRYLLILISKIAIANEFQQPSK